MEKTFTYQLNDVCARSVTITLDGDIIKAVSFERGCQGNTTGVARLCAERSVDEVIAAIEGIQCRGSRTQKTSCPDQLAKALRKAQSGVK